jgi:acetylornithine deacetylase/succinyl-diaminopimelate desuccinylase-like protein
MLDGGHAMNALPQLATALVNCRVLPDETPEYVANTLKKIVNDPQVSIIPIKNLGSSPASPMRADVLKAVTAVTDSEWPGVVTTPIMVMGATDGRFLRAAGIPTYGIDGAFMDRDDVRAHGKDERMSMQSFYESQAFLYQLVKQLSISST